MNPHDLSALGAGFSNEALGSQAVFRTALQSMSHPGRCIHLNHDAQVPKSGHPASAALLLALLDADCTLWLSPKLAHSDAAVWLHFHTGCCLVDDFTQAQFAWVAAGDTSPALDTFAQGTDAFPDQSATCVLDVLALQSGGHDATGWTLTGPGISGSTVLKAEGLAPDFLTQWAANHARFPRGVDVFLTIRQQVASLPRTTTIELTRGS